MITKQGIDIPFAEGLDTKTDKKRVKMGKFLALQNTVFNKGGLLQKRNGFQSLASLPSTSYSYLTTFNENLTAIGPNIAAYNAGASSWVSRGSITPLSLKTLSVISNNLNQTACDVAVASNGTACAVYLESNGATATNKYVVFDSVTGQNLVAPTAIPVASGAVSGGMRVFVVGAYFIIVFTNTITAVEHLQYVAVTIANPSTVTANTDIAASYVSASTLSWDGFVVNSALYLAYNTTSGGQAVVVTLLTSGLTLAPTPRTFSTYKATMMSVTADISTPSNPTVWVSFYRSDTSVGYSLAVDQVLNQILAPTQIITTGTYLNITSAAQSGLCTVFLEQSNPYGYDTAIPSNTIRYLTINVAATVSALGVSINSLGLASKAFISGSEIYYLGVYSSPFQPTYFLINGTRSTAASPNVASRLAYQNGGGYLTAGLPGVTLLDTVAWSGYLNKDMIQAVNKNTNQTGQTSGVYSQTGVNLASFTFGTDELNTVEIGKNLNISGGLTWAYDGYLPVEQNFLLYPDSVEATWNATSTQTPTGTWSSGATTITLSSGSGVSPGMTITDTSNATYIPAGTKIVSISGVTAVISKATTHSAAGDNLSIQGNIAAKPDTATNANAYWYQATYEWSDNQGNIFRSAPSIPIAVTTTGAGSAGTITLDVPTLRVTMKTANPVKIVIYRWSLGQQNYYQVTSITSPTLNITDTRDFIIFVDTLPDADILGNNLIYTTGGVIENVAPPACDLLALFDTRLWLVDAEDRNLLWYSKQVIEATPVEMSDLLTYFVPPTVGNAAGEMTAIYPMDDKLIISKGGNSLVYINGTGPDNTGANNQYSQAIFITSTVGCNNQRSLVVIPQGLLFQSNKGIWLLGRDLSTSYLGAPVEDLTAGAIVLSAVLVPETNQVRFTLDSGVTLMYDYYYDQWGSFYGVNAVSSCIYGDLHTAITAAGTVFQESPGTYLDGSTPVLINFKTGPIRLGDLQGYQRIYFFYLLGDFISPHKMNVLIYYDYAATAEQSVLISPTNYSTPYGSGASQSPYGEQSPYGGPAALEVWRVFPQKQRCMAFNIEVQEIFDASQGAQAGAGFTMSGINAVCGFKKGWRPQPAAESAG